ncbi:hypothetical protein PENANT_c010G03717 [Penicillium antarcticum]|uniref:Mitochondrial thiamine pyrophosphate carrier 1 n=1 Tax=Penicillium antarcticum TaxID=416450 RepID=A0A1V6Q8A8_9EURO|nr:hypothetical protein PENANT_c010G03717 [Penicillium antarcticum]
MTIGKRSDDAPFPSSSPQTITANMPGSNAWTFDESTRNRLLKKYKTQVSSAASTICATISLIPLENIKTRMQTHDFKNVFQCARYLWRNEGYRGYVAGALPPLASVTAVRVVNFTVYHSFTGRISDLVENITGFNPVEDYKRPGSTPNMLGVMTFATAGMFSGLFASPLACPFELAKNVVQTSVLVSNRAMAAPDAARDHTLRHKPRLGTIAAIQQIVKRHGVRGLYTGFRLHAMRDTIGTGMYFAIYDTVKQTAERQLGWNKNDLGSTMLAGVICSTVPWTYPFDTRKTRAQSVLLGKSQEIGEASKAIAKSSTYKGISIIMLRTGLNNMILLSLMEYFKRRIDELPN